MLQLNDPLCARFSDDQSRCLQCAFRSYYDPATGRCQQVSDFCLTWDLSNGACITCPNGYGDAETNGQAING